MIRAGLQIVPPAEKANLRPLTFLFIDDKRLFHKTDSREIPANPVLSR